MSTTLDDDEVLILIDVKSLYTYVPVEESIGMAADLVYAKDSTPDFSKETFFEFMSLTVRNVDILCGETWYRRIDGIAIGSKLAVYLASIWMNLFENVNSGKGNFMLSDKHGRGFPVVADVLFPCGVCIGNFGDNLVQCIICGVSPPMHQPLDFGTSQIKRRRMDVRMLANNTPLEND